jgi:DNA-binding XRE family transcriptional regulator
MPDQGARSAHPRSAWAAGVALDRQTPEGDWSVMPTITDPSAMRAAREAAGMRRETVAEALGVSHSAIVAYERGISDPSARVLIGLARLYGVSAESLCTDGEAVGAR